MKATTSLQWKASFSGLVSERCTRRCCKLKKVVQSFCIHWKYKIVNFLTLINIFHDWNTASYFDWACSLYFLIIFRELHSVCWHHFRKSGVLLVNRSVFFFTFSWRDRVVRNCVFVFHKFRFYRNKSSLNLCMKI